MLQQTSDIIEKIQSSHHSDKNGRYCQFWRIGEVGAKVYHHESTAQNNHDSQKYLHSQGFAPEVLSDVIRFDHKGDSRWMFLTEVAITVREKQAELGYDVSDDSELLDEYEIEWMYDSEFDDLAKMVDEMDDLGLCDYDILNFNYGYLADGSPVVIDCQFYHEM